MHRHTLKRAAGYSRTTAKRTRRPPRWNASCANLRCSRCSGLTRATPASAPNGPSGVLAACRFLFLFFLSPPFPFNVPAIPFQCRSGRVCTLSDLSPADFASVPRPIHRTLNIPGSTTVLENVPQLTKPRLNRLVVLVWVCCVESAWC
jgi:hypothetical protein